LLTRHVEKHHNIVQKYLVGIMDAIAASKTSALASPKIVKNAKGNIVPSSQMAHIAYGCGEQVMFQPSKRGC
jgi:hypothetical protein